MWLDLAAARSSGARRATAVELRDAVANVLAPDQLAEAQGLAREWDLAHPRD